MRLLILISLIAFFFQGQAQSDMSWEYDFPIVISLQFHSLSVPFRNLKANFKNIGIGIGTELPYISHTNWAQRISTVWYVNQSMGNGLLINSQFIWRPQLGTRGYTELKAGVGYLLSKRPVDSYQKVDEAWQPAGKKGKGMLTIPVGIGGGFESYPSGSFLSPFIGYQIMAVTGYSRTIPVLPQTLVELGTRFNR